MPPPSLAASSQLYNYVYYVCSGATAAIDVGAAGRREDRWIGR